MKEKTNTEKPFISVVSPVYFGANTLRLLVTEIDNALIQITDNYEIILVDDHSPDDSWAVIEGLCRTSDKVIGVKLSRNFGQHHAITAGLDECKGEWVFVMDCDLQDQPNQMIKLYEKAMEGYDVVQGQRIERKDGFFKRYMSRIFYRFFGYLSGYTLDSSIANYGIYHRKVIQSINQLRESIRFFPTMVTWVGYKKTTIEIDHGARFEGKSTYNFSKLFRLSLDIFLAYSDKPLRLLLAAGFIIFTTSLLFIGYIAYKYITGKILVIGYMSLISSIWLTSGLLMLMIGIVGLYVGKTFEMAKGRPLYIVDKKIGRDV